jgi:hypothetical protein
VSKIYWQRYRKNSTSKGNVDEPLQALILIPLQSIPWNEVIRVINGEIQKG